MDRNTIKLLGLCLLLSFIILPVIAAPACSFCEFINISKGDNGTPGSVVTIGFGDTWYIDGVDTGVTAIGVNGTDGAPGAPGAPGTMNLTPNMTAGPPGSMNMTMNLTPNMTAGPPGEMGTMNLTPNMTAGPPGAMNLTPNMTAGPPGSMNMTINLTANMTMGLQGPQGNPGGTGGKSYYYANQTQTPPPSGYQTFSAVPLGLPEVDDYVTVSATTGEVLFYEYISNIGEPGVSAIPAGLRSWYTYHYVDDPNGITNIVFYGSIYHEDGTETPAFSGVLSGDINAVIEPELYETHSVNPSDYSINITDRLIQRVYAKTTSASDVIIHFVHDGTNHVSYMQTTIGDSDPSVILIEVIAGEDLKKGQPVYISGVGTGDIPVVSKVDNTDVSKIRIIGLISNDVLTGVRGTVIKDGLLTTVDTRSTNLNINPNAETWAAGDILFTTNNGGLTNTRLTSGRTIKAAYTIKGSNQFDVLLVHSIENPVWITTASNENITLRLGDDGGIDKITIRNYSNGEVASINSYGNATFNGVNNNGYRLTNVKDPVALQDAATKNYVDVVNQTMLANITLYGGSGASIAYVDNVNASMRNNVSIYVTAINQTQIVNVSLNNATMKTYVDNVNASMRNNVSANYPSTSYVNTVNDTMRNNVSLNFPSTSYVNTVNDTMRNNVSLNFPSTSYVNTVNDTMRNNVSTYVIAVNSSMKSYVDAVNQSMLNNVSMYGSGASVAYVDNVNASMRNNVSTYVIAVNSSMKSYVDNVNTSQNTYIDNINTSMRNNVSLNFPSTSYVNTVNDTMRNNVSLNFPSISFVTTVNDTMRNNVSTYVIAVNSSMKSYVDAVNQSMLNNVSMYGSGASVAYVDNVNASMRNNVSIYVTAVNQTQVVNVSMNNATMKTYVDNVNTSMRANVSLNFPSTSYVDNVNASMRNNVSIYVTAVNNTQIVNMSLSNATMKTYVDNVNTTMRANVTKAIAIETNMSAVYPIGSVYITTLSTNPHDIFSGFGTWNSIGSGYVITGV